MRVNQTQFAILGCLTIKPMSAYEVKEFLRRFTGFFWAEQEGQLYPTFSKLAKEKNVIYKEIDADRRGTKKIYSITSSGKKHFQNWWESKLRIPVGRNPLLLKLFFARDQSRDILIDTINDYLDDLDETKAIYQSIEKILGEKKQKKIDIEFYEHTLNYGISINKAEINWCKSTLKKLRGDK